jgi:hypothetical protein
MLSAFLTFSHLYIVETIQHGPTEEERSPLAVIRTNSSQRGSNAKTVIQADGTGLNVFLKPKTAGGDWANIQTHAAAHKQN